MNGSGAFFALTMIEHLGTTRNEKCTVVRHMIRVFSRIPYKRSREFRQEIDILYYCINNGFESWSQSSLVYMILAC